MSGERVETMNGGLVGRMILKITARVGRLIALSLLGTMFSSPCRAQNEKADPSSKTIIIGFVGGILRHGDQRRSEVQLARRLRAEYPGAVVAEVFENNKRKQAHALILREINSTHDRALSAEEKYRARIILYGHSWGGSEAIALARQLQKEGIPVLLTAQVDSVQKIGERDAVIPPNVREAVNFYQLDGAIRGRSAIHAEDPAHTRILGNFRMDYKTHSVTCHDYPWYEMTVAKTHSEIECDPKVWNQIELLIQSKIQH
jgi:hypothetical protein